MTYISPALIRFKSLATLSVLLLSVVSAYAQDSACKSKNGEIKVPYPELAHRMKISGTVRLQLQLTASGSVRDSKVMGGNPILASAAQVAVKQAKFEGSDSCIAVFSFKD